MKGIVSPQSQRAARRTKAIEPKSPTKPVKACEKCKPNLDLTDIDHTPMAGEIFFVKAKGWIEFLSLSDRHLAFIHKFGYNSYAACRSDGYDPYLDSIEIKALELANKSYF